MINIYIWIDPKPFSICYYHFFDTSSKKFPAYSTETLMPYHTFGIVCRGQKDLEDNSFLNVSLAILKPFPRYILTLTIRVHQYTTDIYKMILLEKLDYIYLEQYTLYT